MKGMFHMELDYKKALELDLMLLAMEVEVEEELYEQAILE